MRIYLNHGFQHISSTEPQLKIPNLAIRPSIPSCARETTSWPLKFLLHHSHHSESPTEILICFIWCVFEFGSKAFHRKIIIRLCACIRFTVRCVWIMSVTPNSIVRWINRTENDGLRNAQTDSAFALTFSIPFCFVRGFARLFGGMFTIHRIDSSWFGFTFR